MWNPWSKKCELLCLYCTDASRSLRCVSNMLSSIWACRRGSFQPAQSRSLFVFDLYLMSPSFPWTRETYTSSPKTSIGGRWWGDVLSTNWARRRRAGNVGYAPVSQIRRQKACNSLSHRFMEESFADLLRSSNNSPNSIKSSFPAIWGFREVQEGCQVDTLPPEHLKNTLIGWNMLSFGCRHVVKFVVLEAWEKLQCFASYTAIRTLSGHVCILDLDDQWRKSLAWREEFEAVYCLNLMVSGKYLLGSLIRQLGLRLMQGRVVRSCSAYHRNLPLVETLQLADLGRANGQSWPWRLLRTRQWQPDKKSSSAQRSSRLAGKRDVSKFCMSILQ